MGVSPLTRQLLVLAGAALGGLIRYIVADAIARRLGSRFPFGTFLVNVSGCFLIGVIMTFLTQRAGWHPNWRLFLVVGFLGGYTTFSSFAWESVLAVRQGSHTVALLYMISSVVAGYLAVVLGASLVGRR